MRKFKAEINFLAADAADLLCRIDLFLVRVELCSMRAVMIGTHIRHFSHLQNGIKKAPLRCLVFFEFYAKDIIEVVNAYPCAFLFDDDSIAVVSITTSPERHWSFLFPFSFRCTDHAIFPSGQEGADRVHLFSVP